MNLLDEKSKAWALSGQENNDLDQTDAGKNRETKTHFKSHHRSALSAKKGTKAGKSVGGGGGKSAKKTRKTAEEEDGKYMIYDVGLWQL